MNIKSLKRQAGLNLIEILVAALVLSIGLLSLAGLQVASLKSVQNATQKQQAAYIVHELMERMRSNRDAVLSGDYEVASLSCTSTPPSVDCGSAQACTAQEMAAYDLYTVKCGPNIRVPDEKLTRGQMAVSCISGDCSAGDINITLQWVERISQDGLQGDDGSGTLVELEEEPISLSIDAMI